MAFESSEARIGGRTAFTPRQIVRHARFSAREKLDLLYRIKADVAGAVQNENDIGFSPAEIDEAISEVRFEAENGEKAKTVIWGDN